MNEADLAADPMMLRWFLLHICSCSTCRKVFWMWTMCFSLNSETSTIITLLQTSQSGTATVFCTHTRINNAMFFSNNYSTSLSIIQSINQSLTLSWDKFAAAVQSNSHVSIKSLFVLVTDTFSTFRTTINNLGILFHPKKCILHRNNVRLTIKWLPANCSTEQVWHIRMSVQQNQRDSQSLQSYSHLLAKLAHRTTGRQINYSLDAQLLRSFNNWKSLIDKFWLWWHC